MSKPQNPVDPALLAMLREGAVPYELVPGKKHVHLRVDGKLVLVLPRGNSHNRYGQRNARAQLRRYLREKHTMILRFLSNTYDPKDPHALDYVAVVSYETREQAITRYKEWLSDKIIGEPQASDTYSVEQLKAMGMVGVYVSS